MAVRYYALRCSSAYVTMRHHKGAQIRSTER